MALTEIYVDPSIAADSGAGTVGDPYGDLEYAIEQTTFDTTNGTRVNIKAGTDEVLAADLSTAMADTGTSAAWVTSITAPCVFQGYTTTAGDGGKGGISGGGSVAIFTDIGSTGNFIHFVDLHLHNCGSNTIINCNDQCSVVRCEINNATGNAIEVDSGALVSQNYVYDIQGRGVSCGSVAGLITGNVFKDSTKKFTSVMVLATGAIAFRNIIHLDGGGLGIESTAYTCVMHNSIYTSGNGTSGIVLAASQCAVAVANNLVEGFTNNFDLDASGASVRHYGGNSSYDATTNEFTSIGGYTIEDLGSNETLAASPFTDATNDDFSPVDTGNVKEGALPATFGDGNP